MRFPLLVAVMLLLAFGASAQKIRLKEGSYDPLQGSTEFNVRYEYADMTVTTKDVPEQEFVKQKRSDLNDKDPGRGTTWANSWVKDRESKFEPQFKEEFEKQSRFRLDKLPAAKYTMVVHTTHTETGFNVGVMRRNAYIDLRIEIVETANPSNVVAVITVDNSPGRTAFGSDYDTGGRLAEAYAKAGKEMGQLLRKKLK